MYIYSLITIKKEHDSNVLIEDTSQKLLADKSVGQVEAGQRERDADKEQAEEKKHLTLVSNLRL